VRSDHPAVLLRTRTFGPSLYSVTFSSPELARTVSPGQFAMLEVPDRIRPYLRRAYSVADAQADRGEVEFLVKTIGPGTAALETLPPGSRLRLLGPLGNAFTVSDLPAGARAAVVAGGIGAAPFPLLFRALARAGVIGDLFFGGRTAADVALADRFIGTVNGELHLATNDGSRGQGGFVTDLFARRAETTRCTPARSSCTSTQPKPSTEACSATSAAWPAPTSVMSQPPGARAARASASSRTNIARAEPSAGTNAARGSCRRTSSGRPASSDGST